MEQEVRQSIPLFLVPLMHSGNFMKPSIMCQRPKVSSQTTKDNSLDLRIIPQCQEKLADCENLSQGLLRACSDVNMRSSPLQLCVSFQKASLCSLLSLRGH